MDDWQTITGPEFCLIDQVLGVSTYYLGGKGPDALYGAKLPPGGIAVRRLIDRKLASVREDGMVLFDHKKCSAVHAAVLRDAERGLLRRLLERLVAASDTVGKMVDPDGINGELGITEHCFAPYHSLVKMGLISQHPDYKKCGGVNYSITVTDEARKILGNEHPAARHFHGGLRKPNSLKEDRHAFEPLAEIRDVEDAIGAYAALRPKLFEQLVAVKSVAGGPWRIQYKRDAKNVDPSVPPKFSHHTATVTELAGQPFDGISTVTEVETYAPFTDFVLLDPQEQPPGQGTAAEGISLRLEFLLNELLASTKRLAGGAARLEYWAAVRGLKTDATPLAKLQIQLPAFPYWPQIKGMTAANFETIISNERGALEDAKLALHCLRVEATSSAMAALGSNGPSRSVLSSTRPSAIPRRFSVALSFPGEHRDYVRSVDEELTKCIAQEQVFFDNRFRAELARPDLDTYLQHLYHDDTELIVVFLCGPYDHKQWCGLEWRAIRDLIKRRQLDSIMFFRFDDVPVPGSFSTDGYIDARLSSPKDAAELILQRLHLNRTKTAQLGGES